MDANLRTLLRASACTHMHHWIADVCHGNTKAAIILDRLLFWENEYAESPKPGWGVVLNGNYWAVMSYDDWFSQVYVTRKEAISAIAFLKELGLLHTCTKKFNGVPKLHLRANQSAVVASEHYPKLPYQAPHRRTQKEASPGPVRKDNADVSKKESSYSMRSTRHLNQASANAAAKAKNGNQKKTSSGMDGKGKPEQGKNSTTQNPPEALSLETIRMRAKEAEKMDNNQNTGGRKNYKDTGYQVGCLWKTHLGLITGKFVPEFTRKQESQMRRVVELIINAQPLGSAADVVDWTLTHWGTFGHKVAVQVGSELKYPPPSEPDLGFVYKFYAVAVNLYNQHRKAEILAHAKPVDPNFGLGDSMIVPPVMPPKTNHPSEDKVSLAEVEAALAEFDPEFKPLAAAA